VNSPLICYFTILYISVSIRIGLMDVRFGGSVGGICGSVVRSSIFFLFHFVLFYELFTILGVKV